MSTSEILMQVVRPVFGPIAKAHHRLTNMFKQAAYGVRDGYRAKRQRL